MHGRILIYKPSASEPDIRPYARALQLDDLKNAIGGGWLEAVPGFDSIMHEGKLRRCVAFCDEEGKLAYRTSGQPSLEPDQPNRVATELWAQALGRRGVVSPYPDYLVGQIAIVIGDDAFLEAL